MRLISLASILTGGLLLGWAASAQAAPAAPPAEPIFYCPSPPAHAAARLPAKHARRHACPTQRLARNDRDDHRDRWRDHDHDADRDADHDRDHAHDRDHDRLASREHDDVSESQAFIYRYERALHGLNARAADEAWAHPNGFWPHGRRDMADNAGPGWRADEARGDGDHDRHGDDRDGHADHMGPPDHHWDGEHMTPPDHHDDAEAALRADDARRHGDRDEQREHGDSSGWSSAGDAREHVWTYRSGQSSEHSSGWTHHEAHAGDGEWRDGSYGQVVEYAGRNAHGYLVWPGKTPQADIRPDRDDDR